MGGKTPGQPLPPAGPPPTPPPTDQQIVQAVTRLMVLIELAMLVFVDWRLPWRSLSGGPSLVSSLYLWPNAQRPLTPAQWLRAQVWRLAHAGRLLSFPCRSGQRCHGGDTCACGMLRVDRAPWPAEAVGETWARIVAPALQLELEVCGDLGRLLRRGVPLGVVLLRGEGPGLELEFKSLHPDAVPARGAEPPSWQELTRLEILAGERLRARPHRLQEGTALHSVPVSPSSIYRAGQRVTFSRRVAHA